MATDPSAGRGRDAERPSEIPQAGWRDVLLRLRRRMVENHLPVIAAGVAFYALLAAFPALTALFGVYGLMFEPQEVTCQLTALGSVLPAEASELLLGQLQDLAQSNRAALGLGVAGGLLLALWSASVGVRNLMEALNVAYGEEEKRGFLHRAGLALLLTLGALACVLAAMGALVVLPVATRLLGGGAGLQALVLYARWPLLALLFWFGLLVAYRHGPSRAPARWSWLSWGALAGTVLWLAGSALFSLYVASFGRYNKAYGSMGAVVVLLLWLLLSAYAVLIGAEINAELERQTRRDTTEGARKPLGQRGARAADTVGESPPAAS